MGSAWEGGVVAAFAALHFGWVWRVQGPDGPQAGSWETGFGAIPEAASESKQKDEFVN